MFYYRRGRENILHAQRHRDPQRSPFGFRPPSAQSRHRVPAPRTPGSGIPLRRQRRRRRPLDARFRNSAGRKNPASRTAFQPLIDQTENWLPLLRCPLKASILISMRRYSVNPGFISNPWQRRKAPSSLLGVASSAIHACSGRLNV